MTNFIRLFVILSFTITAEVSSSLLHAASPIYTDDDLAPSGSPHRLINSADYLIFNRLVLNQIAVGNLKISHEDIYPVSAPDRVLNIQHMLLSQRQLVSQDSNRYIQKFNLLEDTLLA